MRGRDSFSYLPRKNLVQLPQKIVVTAAGVDVRKPRLSGSCWCNEQECAMARLQSYSTLKECEWRDAYPRKLINGTDRASTAQAPLPKPVDEELEIQRWEPDDLIVLQTKEKIHNLQG